MKYNSIVVKLGEFMVRRTWYRNYMVNRLIISIKKALKKHGITYNRVFYSSERIIIYIDDRVIEASSILSKVFGVSATMPALVAEEKPSIESINKIIERVIIPEILREKPSSYVVRASSNVDQLSSKAIEKYIGRIVSSRTNSVVNLVNPEKTFYIDLRPEFIAVSDREYEGVGGLPYGVESCLVSLVSGGVDSAVATWYAMKRGVEVIPVFINMYPFWSEEAIKRAYEGLDLLWKWIPWDYMKAYIVGGVGEIIANASVPPRLRCVLCKIVMHLIGSLIAEKEGCRGIVTGEAVGQVASQTLDNLSTIMSLSPKPVFTPIGFLDKIEIIKIAHRLGFERLNREVGSCKLKPLHPKTRVSDKDIHVLKKVVSEIHDNITRVVEESNIIEYKT